MNPVLLLVLDGWGYSKELPGNAIARAPTPNMDRLCKERPWIPIGASGEAVGLPPGQMGNSEVGHLNLGAGRIVYQDLTRIKRAIKGGQFFQNRVLLEAMAKARRGGGAVHLLGLVSNGGVHSHFTHLLALLEMAGQAGVEQVYIHAILDGRDTPPTSARPFLGNFTNAVRSGVFWSNSLYLRSLLCDGSIVAGNARKKPVGPMFTVRGYRLPTRSPPWRRLTSGETDEFVTPMVIEAGGLWLPFTQDTVICFISDRIGPGK